MEKLFNNLLISSPNDGGIFFIHEKIVFKLDNFDTTGLFVIGKKVLRGIQPSRLYIYDTKLPEITNSSLKYDDIHDVCEHDNYIYVVGTTGNEIIKLNKFGEEIKRWVFPGEEDSHHINCVGLWNGRIVFSAFGDFTEHRGYKGNTDNSGFVQDLLTGQRLITNLSQPHSLVSIGQNLLIANSEKKELLEVNESGSIVRKIALDGYTRGISVTEDTIYIGLSCSRNIETTENSSARVVAIERESWTEIGRIDVPVSEIYAIQWLNDIHDVAHIVAKIASMSVSKVAFGMAEYKRRNTELNRQIDEQDAHLHELKRQIDKQDAHLHELKRQAAERDEHINQLLSSLSWRVTKPLRFVGRLFRREFKTARSSFPGLNLKQPISFFRRSRNAMRYVLKGDFKAFHERFQSYKRDTANASLDFSKQNWGILTTKHTLFIAHLMAERLKLHGWNVEILIKAPISFNHDWYIVLCSQMFDRLPPGEKRIVYQLEQSVSSRWFSKNYFHSLNNSLAILDYSLINIDFLQKNKIQYPQVYYLPIGSTTNYWETSVNCDKCYDILFYGDSNSSPRRKKMLDVLQQHFNVQILNNSFEHEIRKAIKKARVVVNIHYYENALLEMPRIQECLSFGAQVVSEMAQDQSEYPEILDAVIFFEEGSVPEMLSAVRLALDNPVPQEKIYESVTSGAKKFAFMFDRFLLALGFLPSSRVKDMLLPLPHEAHTVALSLPETINRRRIFENTRPPAVVIFDGIRRNPGWLGCGLSFLALAQHALENDLTRLTVMEDDVILPSDFEEKIPIIHEYLNIHEGNWDVFAGVIASLHPDCTVLSVELFKDIMFVIIDKMTSMVFNIYSRKFLRLMLSWDYNNLDSATNTIDRFIESRTNLRVVVPIPFFVGHREEVNSTLWGFKNSQYRELIAESETILQKKIQNFRN